MTLFGEILLEVKKKEGIEKKEERQELAVAQEKVEEAIDRWKQLVKIQALLDKALGPIKKEISSIEDFLTPVTKEAYKGIYKVNDSIVELKSRSTTSVKYQQVVQKALEIANEEHRKILEATIESVTTRGVSESVKLLDPELDKYLADIKDAITGDDILERLGDLEKLPRNIINKKKRDGLLGESQINEAIIPSIKKIFGDISRMLKLSFNKVQRQLNRFNKAADKFADAVASAAE